MEKNLLKQNKESEVLIMLHVEIKTLQSQTALGYEIPGEYDSDYSKSGAYWNHINFKEYPAYPEGIHDYGEVGLWTHPDHISGELHYFFGFLTDSTEIPDGFHKVEILFLFFDIIYQRPYLSGHIVKTVCQNLNLPNICPFRSRFKVSFRYLFRQTT